MAEHNDRAETNPPDRKPPVPVVFGYRSPNRWLYPFGCAVFTAIAVGYATAGVTGTSVDVVVLVGLILIAATADYQFLVRTAHTIEVRENSIRWQTMYRRHEASLIDLTGNGPYLGCSALYLRKSKPIVIIARTDGWVRFLEVLNRTTPEQPFEPSLSDRMWSKWPSLSGARGYYEGTSRLN